MHKQHFAALMAKNWILWKRTCCCSFFEIALPIIFSLFLWAIRALVDTDLYVEKSYLNNQTTLNSQLIQKYDLSEYAYNQEMLFSSPELSQIFEAQLKENHIKNCKCQSESCHSGLIGLVPETNDMIKELGYNFEYLGLGVKYFESNEKLEQFVGDEYYGSNNEKYPRLCFAVVMNQNGNSGYEYSIRFNSSMQGNSDEDDANLDVYDTKSFRISPLRKINPKNYERVIQRGFAQIQAWLDNMILRKETNDESQRITARMMHFKMEEYTDDPLPEGLRGSTDFYTSLPLLLIFLRYIYSILSEKEKKIREGMKMMGMTNFSFYSSWVITYLVIFTIINLGQTIIQKLFVFKETNFFLLFLLFWMFSFVLLAHGLFLTVFFTQAKVGLILSLIWFLILYQIRQLIDNSNTQVADAWKKNLASLSPHTAISLALDNILMFESEQVGMDFSNAGDEFYNYKVSTCYLMLLLNIFIFFVLGVYLDQVFPNEFGKKKHPLFFLKSSKEAKTHNNKILDKIETQGMNQNQKNENIEPVDQQHLNQIEQKMTIQIKNLEKTYGNGKRAVKNLDLSMFTGEIFVLLGHNGAGKTTTISMLTGLLDATGGEAYIMGKNISDQMDEIRKFLGVCPQHDILFDNLTVREHLLLFSAFKGVAKQDREQQVEKMIEDLDLKFKTDELSKNLSGGQKRRLSVGIAFIGNSKVVLLDEPTSGMDTSARRFIWEMLRNYRNGRIVILTTHFMDEADFLGDRIGIMGEGELKCCGSSIFLKNKFGVGYNLVVVKESAERREKIEGEEALIKKHVPEAIKLSDVSAEVTYQLPIDSLSKFKGLFTELDSKLKEFHIQTYGISITTLEEVFLKVASGDDPNQKSMTNSQIQVDKKEKNKDLENFDLGQSRVQGSMSIFFSHFAGLFIKRYHYSKRDKKGILCEIVVPIIMVLLGLLLTTISFLQESVPLEIEAGMYDFVPLKVTCGGTVDQSVQNSIGSQFSSEEFSFEYLNVNDINQWDQQVFEKKTRERLGAYFIEQYGSNNAEYVVAVNSIAFESQQLFLHEMNKALIKQKSGRNIEIVAINDPLPFTKQMAEMENSIDGFLGAFIFSIGMSFIPSSIIVFIIKERSTQAKHQQIVSGVSIFAYWASNYALDIIKYLIPAIVSCLLAKAFDVKAFASSDTWGGTWAIFIFYGFSLVSFTYLFSFLFKSYSNGQLLIYFFFFIAGGIVVVFIFILRLIDSTKNYMKVLIWFLRFIPSFAFGFGLIGIANRELFAIIDEYWDAKNALSIDLAGGDLLMLCLTALLYFVLVFVVEKLLTMQSVQRVMAGEFSRKSIDMTAMDSDVKQEMIQMENTNPKDYQICVNKLRKVYSTGTVAVKQLSFGIGNGECFGLLGVNGAGKTTTFKMLCGEIPPTAGDAHLFGWNIKDDIREAQKLIGYCPQFDALLDLLTVKEHLELYAVLKGIPKNLIPGLVEQQIYEMDLQNFKNNCANQLSGGNKRKLSVAMALIGNPPIIFLDEPSTGMDPVARRFMWTVISRVSTLRKKSSVVLTTHSMEEAEALATKIGIMVNGEFKCLGSIQHIKSKFGKGYELEIKVRMLTSTEEIARKHNIDNGGQLHTIQQCGQVLEGLGKGYLVNFINQNGAGSSLYYQLKKSEGLQMRLLLEYFIVETEGQEIMNFLQSEIGEFQIIEHFGVFFRFKLNVHTPVAQIFGIFEDNKNRLGIEHYSIKQATIEQIFNMFAKNQIDPEELKQNSIKMQHQEAEPPSNLVQSQLYRKQSSMGEHQIQNQQNAKQE